MTTTSRMSVINGVRERGLSTVWPLSRTMCSGLKMRSNRGAFFSIAFSLMRLSPVDLWI